ncbi:26S proteasome non-ATPase regulatory subunit 11 [Datura stramonium]|uniref:26S proteasome non-ATPase regulatory subunit 11 n=1 Tax=Datura stramonium TaxID=4076 RepID=A0ABS8SDS5_DATST|nr:26S proteasome non-ATPase regulatory subunit 11 [Datura stramonium]
MENKEYSEALTLLSGLIKEVRRLDDKLLLMEIDLLESKLHFSLRNLPKAKAVRTAANAIYVPPNQQGVTFEVFNALARDPKDKSSKKDLNANAKVKSKAIYSLKYMLPCKIMVSLQADDVAGIISSCGLEYLGPESLQGAGCLAIFEDLKRDAIYPATLETISNMGKVVDSLFITSSKLMA